MSNKPTIFLLGEYSSGKSSVINSIASAYISNVSIQRETFNKTAYHFSNNGNKQLSRNISDTLDIEHKENETMRNKLELKEEEIGKLITRGDDINSLYTWLKKDFVLYDFPGKNDSDDKSDNSMKLYKSSLEDQHPELVIYLTSAERAFTSSKEVQDFKEIKSKIEEINKSGWFSQLLVVVNKFDKEDDIELNQIYDRISSKIDIPINNIFKYSSHKSFVNALIENKIDCYVPKFAKKEISNIFKNANIITKRNMIDNNNLIKHDKLEYRADLQDSDLEDDLEVVVDNNVDNNVEDNVENKLNNSIIKYIENFNPLSRKRDYCYNVLFPNWLIDVKKIIENTRLNDCIITFNLLIKYCNNNLESIPDDSKILSLFAEYIDYYFLQYTSSKLYFTMLHLLWQFANEKVLIRTLDMLQHVIWVHRDKLHITTHLLLRMLDLHNNDIGGKWDDYLLSFSECHKINSIIYNKGQGFYLTFIKYTEGQEFYHCIDKKICTAFVEYGNYLEVIKYDLSKKYNYLLSLSTLSKSQLTFLDKMNKIQYDKIDLKFKERIKYYLYVVNANFPLNHLLFNEVYEITTIKNATLPLIDFEF